MKRHTLLMIALSLAFACGGCSASVSEPTSRAEAIQNGEAPPAGELYDATVALFIDHSDVCTGTAIATVGADQWIITAAHCFLPVLGRIPSSGIVPTSGPAGVSVGVFVGPNHEDIDLEDDAGRQDATASFVVVHPDFVVAATASPGDAPADRAARAPYDIALLRIPDLRLPTVAVTPSEVGITQRSVNGQAFMEIIGYGRQGPFPLPLGVRRRARLRLSPSTTLLPGWPTPPAIQLRYSADGPIAMAGDSGGPVLWRPACGFPTLHGVISQNNRDLGGGVTPGIGANAVSLWVTNAAFYREWILDTVAPDRPRYVPPAE